MRRKSGEEIVAEMKMAAEEKREFYVNIARWVDTVSFYFIKKRTRSCLSYIRFELYKYIYTPKMYIYIFGVDNNDYKWLDISRIVSG